MKKLSIFFAGLVSAFLSVGFSHAIDVSDPPVSAVGDNLGNHVASQTLNMGNNAVANSSGVFIGTNSVLTNVETWNSSTLLGEATSYNFGDNLTVTKTNKLVNVSGIAAAASTPGKNYNTLVIGTSTGLNLTVDIASNTDNAFIMAISSLNLYSGGFGTVLVLPATYQMYTGIKITSGITFQCATPGQCYLRPMGTSINAVESSGTFNGFTFYEAGQPSSWNGTYLYRGASFSKADRLSIIKSTITGGSITNAAAPAPIQLTGQSPTITNFYAADYVLSGAIQAKQLIWIFQSNAAKLLGGYVDDLNQNTGARPSSSIWRFSSSSHTVIDGWTVLVTSAESTIISRALGANGDLDDTRFLKFTNNYIRTDGVGAGGTGIMNYGNFSYSKYDSNIFENASKLAYISGGQNLTNVDVVFGISNGLSTGSVISNNFVVGFATFVTTNLNIYNLHINGNRIFSKVPSGGSVNNVQILMNDASSKTPILKGNTIGGRFTQDIGVYDFGSVPKFSAGNTTGGGTALLGTNSPAAENSAPYTWFTVTTGDGSVGYIPAWK